MSNSINPYMGRDLPPIEFTEKKQERYNNNVYAQMEPKTARIRQKLERRLSEIDQKITQERLEATKQKIYLWIERHSAHRTPVRKESLHLFTEGKSAAPLSKKLNNIRQRLKTAFYQSSQAHPDLKGRVKKEV